MSNKSSGQQVQYWYHRLEERCIYLCVEEYIPLRIAELCRKRGYTKYRLAQLTGITPVSYTHLDVYKRQVEYFVNGTCYKAKKKFRGIITTQLSGVPVPMKSEVYEDEKGWLHVKKMCIRDRH